jgi:hypothetical protein
MEHDPEIWHAIDRMTRIVEHMHGKEVGLHFERKKPNMSFITGPPKIEDTGVDSKFQLPNTTKTYGDIKEWHDASKTALANVEKKIKAKSSEAGLAAKKINLVELENVLYDYRTDLLDTYNLMKTCTNKDEAFVKRLNDLKYTLEDVKSWGKQ